MKILKVFLFIFLFISCQSNNTKPESSDDSSTTTLLGNNSNNSEVVYTEEELALISEMDRKYPYFNVNLDSFKVHVDAPLSTTITVDDKIYALEALALMRIAVNIPEFETEIKKLTLYSSRKDSYPNSPYSIEIGTKYDNDRVIKVIRAANYNVRYLKAGREDTVFMADVGKSMYVRYGYQNDLEYGKNIYIPNRPWNIVVGYSNFFVFTALLFHEHLHNLGFDHRNGYDMVSEIHKVFQNTILRSVFRTGQYGLDYEKMKKYYKIKNKKWLEGDTVVPPEEYPK